jgi:8-amino-7-oxononanoate synthase
MTDRHARWRHRLMDIADLGQTRILRTLRPTGPVTGTLDGKDVLIACSNDYLALAQHPDVVNAGSGGGAGGSRLISGSRPAHLLLEALLEERYGRPALLFPSGYQANLGVFSTVCEAGDLIASDALNHASIIDGIRLSRADKVVVEHASPSAVPDDAALIAIEGLYSMDGDSPPFGAYPSHPWLAVDEAHAVGCIGPQGKGAAALAGLEPDILIGTFGKAYGAAGAFVIGPPDLKALLINVARSFIFTTAMPEPVARMALAGMYAATDARREQLAARTRFLRDGLHALGWHPLGDAHIVPIVVGPSAIETSRRLLERGIYAPAIRPPTVAAGKERIRLTVSAAHTEIQLSMILDAFGPAQSSI